MSAEVRVDISGVVRKLQNAFEPDDRLKLYANIRLAAYCEPYIPMETGTLSNMRRTTPEYVEYTAPYAHYQYMGEVYGPNIPVRNEAGTIIGWFSPPGQRKQPTGRELTYSKELHPLATDHWDQAAMRARGDDLTEEIARYIVRRYNQT